MTIMKKIVRVIVGTLLGCATILAAFLVHVLIFKTRPTGLALAVVQAVGLGVAYWYIFPFVFQNKPDAKED